MARAIVGLFNTRDEAHRAVRDLRAAGFDQEDIGTISRDEQVGESGASEQLSTSTGGAMAGGAVGGTLGAILAATGALVIPGIGPFISGGILATSLVGGAAGWLVGGLAGLGISREDAEYYEGQVHAGRPLVTVRAGEREAEAQQILLNNGAETTRRTSVGQTTSGLAQSMGPSGMIQSQGGQVQGMNRAEQSGQNSDLVRTSSDDGRVPPTAEREAITTPGGSYESRADLLERAQSRNDEPANTPDQARPSASAVPAAGIAPGAIGLGAAPLREPALGPSAGAGGFDRLEKSPLDRGSAVGAQDLGTMTGADPRGGLAGDNPVPLSPTDPHRESGDGSPYLDDVNPYGRDLVNREGRPMGGVGEPGAGPDPQMRQGYEIPGQNASVPLEQALDPEPTRTPER